VVFSLHFSSAFGLWLFRFLFLSFSSYAHPSGSFLLSLVASLVF